MYFNITFTIAMIPKCISYQPRNSDRAIRKKSFIWGLRDWTDLCSNPIALHSGTKSKVLKIKGMPVYVVYKEF